MKRLLAVALVVMTISFGIVFLPQSAHAADSSNAVIPDSLPACDVFATRGGWDNRNAISSGTLGDNEEYPVRPKSLVLGEPCSDGTYFHVPMRFTDVPVPGNPSSTPSDGFFPDVVDNALDCPSTFSNGRFYYTGVSATNCGVYDQPSPAGYYWVGEMAVSVSGESLTISWQRTNGTAPQGNLIAQYLCYRLGFDPSLTSSYTMASAQTTQSGNVATGWSGAGNPVALNTWYSRTFDCPSGYVPARAFIGATQSVALLLNTPGRGWYSQIIPGSLSGLGEGTGFFDGTQGAQFHIGGNSYSGLSPDPAIPSRMLCRTVYDDLDSRVAFDIDIWHSGMFGDLVPVVDDDDQVVWSAWAETLLMVPLVSSCTYLESIELMICSPIGFATGDWTCVIREWLADRFLTNTPYPDRTPQQVLCDLFPLRAECLPILFPPIVDYADFNVVCAGAPEPEWLDFGWLFEWVGHMATCLFVPQGGIDYRGQIQAQFDRIGVTEVSEATDVLASSLQFRGGLCGPIVDSNVPHLGQVTINTCTWTEFGEARTMVGAGVIVMTLIFGLSVLIGMAESLYGRKGDHPLTKSDKEL